MNVIEVLVSASKTEDIVKMTTPIRNTFFRPYKSLNFPNGIWNIAAASKKIVETQLKVPTPIPNSIPIFLAEITVVYTENAVRNEEIKIVSNTKFRCSYEFCFSVMR